MCVTAPGPASGLSGRWGVGVTQGARQLLMVPGDVQSQRREQEHGGGSGCFGPRSTPEPPFTNWAGTSAAQPERLQLQPVL